MNRTKAYRRFQEAKAKRRAKKYLRQIQMFDWELITPDKIGYQASTHNVPCSCFMCGNPRKFFGERTLKERRADDAFRQWREAS